MAKPILITRIPKHEGYPMSENMWNKINEMLKEQTNNEYHILVVVEGDIKKVEFQVFYEKDFTEVKYGELKKIINDNLNIK